VSIAGHSAHARSAVLATEKREALEIATIDVHHEQFRIPAGAGAHGLQVDLLSISKTMTAFCCARRYLYLLANPENARLRGDPRFQSMLIRVGLQ
jgi:hypothetical protein